MLYDREPNTDMLGNCSWKFISQYHKTCYSGYDEFNYKFSTLSYNFIIVNYQGLSPYMNLYAVSSDNDLKEITKLYPKSTALLSTSYTSDYFYLDTRDYDYSDIYLNLTDKGYDMYPNKLKICYTEYLPTTDIIKGCSSWTTKSPYSSLTSSNYNEYYYSIKKKSTYNHIIVNYQGTNTGWTLYGLSSESEFIAKTFISTEALVFIIIGSIIFLVIVITVVVCCFCKRRKTISDSAEYVPPQQIYADNNPVAYPQTNLQPYQSPQQATPLMNSIN